MREVMLAWDDGSGIVRFYKYETLEEWLKHIRHCFDSAKVLKSAEQAHPEFKWRIETPTTWHPIGDVVFGIKG